MTLAGYVGFLQMEFERAQSSTMRDRYASGWFVSQMDGAPSSTHRGSDGSFYALVALQPSRDVGVAVVLDSAGERSSEAADALLNKLLRSYAAPR